MRAQGYDHTMLQSSLSTFVVRFFRPGSESSRS
jgi:hypothetical protein